MKHPDFIEGYDGTMKDLAHAIGNMRYDKVEEFINELEQDFLHQAINDTEHGRYKLSIKLWRIVDILRKLKTKMNEAWNICEPYMKEKSNE